MEDFETMTDSSGKKWVAREDFERLERELIAAIAKRDQLRVDLKDVADARDALRSERDEARRARDERDEARRARDERARELSLVESERDRLVREVEGLREAARALLGHPGRGDSCLLCRGHDRHEHDCPFVLAHAALKRAFEKGHTMAEQNLIIDKAFNSISDLIYNGHTSTTVAGGKHSLDGFCITQDAVILLTKK